MASPSRYPQLPLPARSKLLSVGRFNRATRNTLRNSLAVGQALRRSLVALGEGQREQSLREIKCWSLRRSKETQKVQYTPKQWKKV